MMIASWWKENISFASVSYVHVKRWKRSEQKETFTWPSVRYLCCIYILKIDRSSSSELNLYKKFRISKWTKKEKAKKTYNKIIEKIRVKTNFWQIDNELKIILLYAQIYPSTHTQAHSLLYTETAEFNRHMNATKDRKIFSFFFFLKTTKKVSSVVLWKCCFRFNSKRWSVSLLCVHIKIRNIRTFLLLLFLFFFSFKWHTLWFVCHLHTILFLSW